MPLDTSRTHRERPPRSGCNWKFDVARRVQARVLITDVPFGPDDTTRARGIPVVLTGDELPERLPTGDDIRIAFLLQPFNARRLLETIEHVIA